MFLPQYCLDGDLWSGDAGPHSEVPGELKPHSLAQYLDCSRFLTRQSEPVRMTYLGYAVMPPDPRGLCH